MNIISLLSSLNVIGLIAFLITLGFLLYEVFLLSRANKTQGAPHIPQFEEGAQPLPPTLQIKDNNWKNVTKNLTKNNKILLITLSILLIFFGSLTLISSLVGNNEPDKVALITPTKAIAINKLPTYRVPTKLISSPTPVDVFFEEPTEVPSGAPTAEPTEIAFEEDVSPTPEITEEPLEETLSPSVITQLPVTSYINNSFVLFSVAGVFLFLSFLM